MSVKASVIVPVYNPGHHIEDCIRTLVDQSLSRDRYEVIFVDDGSTDDTPARLAEVEAAHPHVRVRRIDNSGWPGRPRNVGMDMARGEYVLFVDNDDWLEHEALERMVAMADRDGADIVIGKVVGHGKAVPRGVFRQNRSGVTFDWSQLVWLLTPHKLFRRSFLEEHGIRFPEGRRRLEDHPFVMHAYFHAQGRISVLADYPCYHWVLRDSRGNASAQLFEPVGYYENLREVLDLIDEHTEPGELRDRLYLRWYRGKALHRVGMAGWLGLPPDYRRARYDEVHRLVLERFPERLDAKLPLGARVRARLVRRGDYEGLLRLAELESALQADVRVHEVESHGDDALTLRFEATLGGGAGDLLRFAADGDDARWMAPDVLAARLGDRPLVTRALGSSDAALVVRRRRDNTEFALPLEQEVRLAPVPGAPGEVRPAIVGTARVSAASGAAGSPLPSGLWQVLATPTIAGFRASGPARLQPGGDTLELLIQDGQVSVAKLTLRRRLGRRVPWLRRQVRRVRARTRGAASRR